MLPRAQVIIHFLVIYGLFSFCYYNSQHLFYLAKTFLSRGIFSAHEENLSVGLFSQVSLIVASLITRHFTLMAIIFTNLGSPNFSLNFILQQLF